MATLTFYNLAKRKNSTAAPTGAGTDFDVTLKERTDLLQPVFLLNYSGTPTWTYAAYQGRYYFVTGVESVHNDLWYIHCEVDVLATYKAAIQAASAFVQFDTAANTEITDKRLSTKTTTVRVEAAGNAFDYLGKGFCVALNVVGEYTSATYMCSLNTAMNLLNYMQQWTDDNVLDLDWEDYDGLEEIACAIWNAITYGFKQIISSGSAADCIKSAYIIPLPLSTFGVANDRIYLGKYDTHCFGIQRSSRGFQDASNVTIPWQASDWRRNAPYHEIYLYIPFVGNISIPPQAVIGKTSLYVNVAIDETAGDAVFTISADPVSGGSANHVLGQYTANLAANFAIGSSNITPAALFSSIAATAGVVASSLIAPPVGVAAGFAGIAGELNAATPLPSSIGSAGGGAMLALFGYAPRCFVLYHDTVVAPDSVSAIMGTPTMAVKSLSGLSGFVQTIGASVAGNMTDTERMRINQMLDGGIYIE